MSLISRRASYGLRTLIRLAELAPSGRAVTISQLADSEHLPHKYLEQVLRELKQAGLVDSRPGPHGGCRLARPARHITVGDVVRALDGEPRPGHCLNEGHGDDADQCPGCWGLNSCAMREVWTRLGAAMNQVLNSTTLEDLVRRQRELTSKSVADYHI